MTTALERFKSWAVSPTKGPVHVLKAARRTAQTLRKARFARVPDKQLDIIDAGSFMFVIAYEDATFSAVLEVTFSRAPAPDGLVFEDAVPDDVWENVGAFMSSLLE